MAAVAQSYMLRDQVEATCEWADKARGLAEAHGLDDVRLAAMVEKGSALMLDARDQADEGRRLLQTAADEAERIGDHVLAARALNNLVWHARQWSDADEVRELIERAHRHAEAAGFDWSPPSTSRPTRRISTAAEGDLDAAIAHLDHARYTSAGNAVSWTDGRWLAVLRAGLALEAGDLDDRPALHRAWPSRPPRGPRWASSASTSTSPAGGGDLAEARSAPASLRRCGDP